MSILAIGTMAFDSIETRYGKVDMVIGGACTYISWAASYLHRDINVSAIVGEDFPQAELDALRARGVNVDGVEIKEGRKSFYWSGKYHDDMIGRDTLVTDLNVLDEFNPVLPDSYKDSEYVMLGNLTPDIQIQVLDQLNKPKLVVLDTMNFWMDIAMDRLKEAITRVDVLTINDEEARQLSGEYSLVDAAKAIHAMGPKYLVVKKGEHGALLFHDSKVFSAPALPLPVVKDPTGAGDCFAGGFIGHIARTGDTSFDNMKTATIYGSIMASFCVEEFSLERIQSLDDADIAGRMEQFKELTNFAG